MPSSYKTGSPECLAAARLDLLPMYVRGAREMELAPLSSCGGRLASNSHMLNGKETSLIYLAYITLTSWSCSKNTEIISCNKIVPSGPALSDRQLYINTYMKIIASNSSNMHYTRI
jgi:hypothetical protein